MNHPGFDLLPAKGGLSRNERPEAHNEDYRTDHHQDVREKRSLFHGVHLLWFLTADEHFRLSSFGTVNALRPVV